MKVAIKRWICRWIHAICGIAIIAHICSPVEQIANYAPATRFIFLPVMLPGMRLSGVWMWKGQLFRELIAKDQPQEEKPA